MILVASWIIFQLATWKVAELALKLSREHGARRGRQGCQHGGCSLGGGGLPSRQR